MGPKGALIREISDLFVGGAGDPVVESAGILKRSGRVHDAATRSGSRVEKGPEGR